MQYLFLFVGWAIYFFLHSFLASNRVKNFISNHYKGLDRYYRITYNLISATGLIWLLYYGNNIPSQYIIKPGSLFTYLGLILAASGAIIIREAFKSYSMYEFLGIRPNQTGRSLSKAGILKHIRHPIYSGTILIAIGYWAFIPTISSLITISIIFIYLGIGIKLEERKLIDEFGDQYRRYKKEVPALIPKIRKN